MTDWRPVYDAATLNDVDALHRLEADDHSLIQSDPVEGCTPLFSACWHGCSEAVSFILHNHDGGSSVNMATVHGATPAYAAALRGEAAILKLLHVAGADLSTPDNEGATPLHAAVYHRHTETVEYLLSCYDVTSKINVSHAGNITVLWVAVQRGDEQLISALKEQGASFGHMPSEKTRGFTPPDHRPPPTLGAMALQQRRTATVSSNDSQSSGGGSLGGGARQVKSEAVSGKAAVFRAAALGDIDELLNMAALGENMDTADNFGRTPLRVACEENHPKCVKFLIARGSNKEARDAATGSTPLHVAAGEGHTETVLALLEGGADPRAKRESDGATPLWVACDGGHESAVATMLEWKKKAVDPDVRDETEKKKKPLSPPSLTRPHPPPHPFKARTNDGVRPIEVACAKNHSAVADLLLSKGVTSFVDPGLWMGLKMGSWMIRKQLPEAS